MAWKMDEFHFILLYLSHFRLTGVLYDIRIFQIFVTIWYRKNISVWSKILSDSTEILSSCYGDRVANIVILKNLQHGIYSMRHTRTHANNNNSIRDHSSLYMYTSVQFEWNYTWMEFSVFWILSKVTLWVPTTKIFV